MIVRGKYLIVWPETGDAGGTIVDGAVRVEDRYIKDIGRFPVLQSRYSKDDVIGSPNHIIAPGLVNAHHHGRAISTIEMGIRDEPLELLLFSLLTEPFIDPHMSAHLSALRLLETGVTTIIHSHRHWGSPGEDFSPYRDILFKTIDGYLKAGIRVAFSMDGRDRPSLVYGDIEPFLLILPEELKMQVQRLAKVPVNPDYRLWFKIFDEACHRCKDTRINMLLGPLTAHSCSQPLLMDIKRKATESNYTHLRLLIILDTPSGILKSINWNISEKLVL
jgi:cytosine/adenosine deaminase-related metal-dependent hydrolase